MPPRLNSRPYPDCNTRAVWPSDSPICLFSCAPITSASGPTCTGRSQPVGSLQGVAPLRPCPAALAIAHLNIETAHHCPPDDVFLILRLGPLHLHRAPARATPRQRRRQHFIHALRHRPERGRPKVSAALAARRFGFRLRIPFGKRRSFPMDGPTGLLQILL